MAEVTHNRPMSEMVTWWIGACVAVATAAQVWAMIEIRGVIERGRSIDNQIVTITSATTVLAHRTTELIEDIEQSRSESILDMGFREPAPGTIKPEEMSDSITPQED